MEKQSSDKKEVY